MTRWYRRYAGTCSDPKLAEAAMIAGCSRSVAIAAWDMILESAAETNDGARFRATSRNVAATICETLETVERVFSALETLGMISEGTVTAWSKRQYQSDNSTERSRKHRALKRGNGDATLQGRRATPPDTDTDTDTEKKNTPLPPNGGMVGVQVNDHWSKEAANIKAKAAYEAGLQIKQGVATKSARATQAAVGELDGSKGITLREGRLTVSPEIASDLAAEYPGIDVKSVCDKAAPEVLKQRYPRRDDALASLRKWARCALEDKARGRGATPQKAATFGPKVIPWDHKVKLVEGYDRTKAWPLSAGPRPGMPGSVITAEEVARARAEYSPRGASMTGGANGAH